MRSNRAAWKRLLIGLCSGVSMIAAGLHGCGGSTDVKEIPESAKKSLFQKKVDFENRPTKAPRTGNGNAKRPTGSPRP